ncbi:MAG: alpha/beta hydrolase [Candidatus Binatia bacterium]
MAPDPRPPHIEGTVLLPDRRTLGFAEFGPPDGKPIFWFHGTPGARRQIPPEARLAAAKRHVRLIGIDRPGVGASTAHVYPSLLSWAHDIRFVADRLGVDRFGLIGLSGGGPYVLACAHALPARVVAGAILGGVAPARGPEAPVGGVVGSLARFESLFRHLHEPLGILLTMLAWALRPVASPTFDFFMRLSPVADRAVFARPEMKAMFIDDLLQGSRWGLRAPIYDLMLFCRPWGFRVRDIRVPVRFWHGDADHLVPIAHGRYLARLVRDSEFFVRHGESHLGGLAAAEEILDAIVALWPEESGPPRRYRRARKPLARGGEAYARARPHRAPSVRMVQSTS